MSEEREVPGYAFISYVREDSWAVDRLHRVLQAAGVRVWRDTADLWPGQDWRARIRRAITDDALVFIACFSQSSVRRDKSYQNEELTLAIEQMRRRQPDDSWLIPVRLDDCEIPDWDIGGGRTLASIQQADLSGDLDGEHVARLVAAVLRVLGRLSEHHARLDALDVEAVAGGHGPTPPVLRVQAALNADHAARLLTDAEETAQSITYWYDKVSALAGIAAVLAGIDRSRAILLLAEAKRLARSAANLPISCSNLLQPTQAGHGDVHQHPPSLRGPAKSIEGRRAAFSTFRLFGMVCLAAIPPAVSVFEWRALDHIGDIARSKFRHDELSGTQRESRV